jgi:hypothetical protein
MSLVTTIFIVIYLISNIFAFLWFTESGLDDLLNEGFMVKHLIMFMLFAPMFTFVFLLTYMLYITFESSKLIGKKTEKFFNKKLF